MTHDYKRNGAVDLFAAMNLATGEVLHDTRRSHIGADVSAFFKWIDIHVNLIAGQPILAVIHPNSEVIRMPTFRSQSGDITSLSASQNSS